MWSLNGMIWKRKTEVTGNRQYKETRPYKFLSHPLWITLYKNGSVYYSVSHHT